MRRCSVLARLFNLSACLMTASTGPFNLRLISASVGLRVRFVFAGMLSSPEYVQNDDSADPNCLRFAIKAFNFWRSGSQHFAAGLETLGQSEESLTSDRLAAK